jgi:hypothetical protein
MKNKTVIFCLAFIFLLAGLGIFYAKNAVSNIIEGENLFTKAICDNKNYCEDYEILCKGKEVIKLTPTGAAIQFPEDWKDPRHKEEIELLCA